MQTTNMDLGTGIRYTSAYVNSQNISGEFIEEIIQKGTDLGYQSWRAEAIAELKGILETLESGSAINGDTTCFDLSTSTGALIDAFTHELKRASFLNPIDESSRVSPADLLDEITEDFQISSESVDALMESSGYWDLMNDNYESGSNTWRLEEKDLTVTYNNDDNSICILSSRFVTLLSKASPCFPNGCFMKQGSWLGFCLEFDCFEEFTIKELGDLPYTWIYDLENNYFLQAVLTEDGQIEAVRAEADDKALETFDLSPDVIQELKQAAENYRKLSITLIEE